MTWWLWVLAGIGAYAFLLLVTWALCKSAGDEDERKGYK